MGFEKKETKLGNPSKQESDFGKKIKDELQSLHNKQYSINRKWDSLDPNKVHEYFKSIYKLVKLIDLKSEFHDYKKIVIRYNKSISICIEPYKIFMVRAFDVNQLYTLEEMGLNGGHYGSKDNRFTSRKISDRGYAVLKW